MRKLVAPPRAYVLLVVMIVAAAAASAAALLLLGAGQGTVSAISGEGGERAASIAEAGLEHTLAVLERSGASDFDEELDPGLLADCTNLASSGTTPACTACGLPAFKKADGSNADIVVFEGERYRRLPYDGGAYLVRYQDDDDDQILDTVSAGTFASFTNNHLGIANRCVEGPISVALNGQNPVRDRNRTIWVTVIGIHPGIDPAAAKHRVVLRRLHTAIPPSTVAGMKVRGNIEVSGSGSLYACSPIGSVEADGNFQAGSGVVPGSNPRGGCACGDSKADSTAGFEHCTETSACSTYGIECAEGELSTPGPNVAALGSLVAAGADGADFYFEWDRPCVFYVQGQSNLWFWDATSSRGAGGQPCSAFEGQNLAFPGPPDLDRIGDTPASNADNWRGCWTPLWWDVSSSSALSNAVDAPQCRDGNNKCCGPEAALESGSCVWRPRNESVTYSVNVTSANGTGGGASGGNLTFTKPAWGTACTINYPPFPTALQTTETLSCSGNSAATSGAAVRCDGTNSVMQHLSAKNLLWFDFDDADDRRAIPAGVYFFAADSSLSTNIEESGNALDMNMPLISGFPPSFPNALMPEFPLITLASTGNIKLNGDIIVGAGQETPAFPSLMFNGNVMMQGGANYALGGSIFNTGNVEWTGDGDNVLYGELHTNGNVQMTGNGRLLWNYTNALQAPPIRSTGPPLTLPSLE